MARRCFFVENIHSGHALITGRDAHHLRKVLRARPGQQFELCDNQRSYLAEVIGFKKDGVLFRILGEAERRSPSVTLHLLVALFKFDRLEDLLEKATELGVSTIQFFVAARTQGGLERAATKRMQRWQRIVKEASQQSRRTRLPEILPLASFQEIIGRPFQLRYFLDEQGASPLINLLPPVQQRSPADSIGVLVGPEGGWTDQERELAIAHSWQPVSMGELILRTETAAMAALAVLGSAWLAAQSVAKTNEASTLDCR